MTSFQSSELTELPEVENSQLFTQHAHSAQYAPPTRCAPLSTGQTNVCTSTEQCQEACRRAGRKLHHDGGKGQHHDPPPTTTTCDFNLAPGGRLTEAWEVCRRLRLPARPVGGCPVAGDGVTRSTSSVQCHVFCMTCSCWSKESWGAVGSACVWGAWGQFCGQDSPKRQKKKTRPMSHYTVSRSPEREEPKCPSAAVGASPEWP